VDFTTNRFFSAISAYLCDLCVTVGAGKYLTQRYAEIAGDDFNSRQGLLFVQSWDCGLREILNPEKGLMNF
jgi:hypothetical protein